MGIVEQIRATKTLVFTVTPGRSGTTYLTELLNGLPRVAAFHEPAPKFTDVMRHAQLAPAEATTFLLKRKLPTIAKIEAPIYAEASHVFCKGFFVPALQLGLRPKLIVLRRNPTDVAWSLVERRTVPGRTAWGFQFLLEPRDPGVMPLLGWESMTDFQLCFWYALEIERRQLLYAGHARAEGLACHEILNRELKDFARFGDMLRALDLPSDGGTPEMHASVSAITHNPNKAAWPRPDNLVEQEEEVWARIAHFEPYLRGEIKRRHDPKEPVLAEAHHTPAS